MRAGRSYANTMFDLCTCSALNEVKKVQAGPVRVLHTEQFTHPQESETFVRNACAAASFKQLPVLL